MRFLELHYWADRVKYVLPDVSKLWTVFSLKLFVQTGCTFPFDVKQTERGVSHEIWHFWPLEIGGVGDKHPHDSDHPESIRGYLSSRATSRLVIECIETAGSDDNVRIWFPEKPVLYKITDAFSIYRNELGPLTGTLLLMFATFEALWTPCNLLMWRSGHTRWRCLVVMRRRLRHLIVTSCYRNSSTDNKPSSTCSVERKESTTSVMPSLSVILLQYCWCLRLTRSLLFFVIDSVCPFVTLLQIASSFLFVDGIEPFFGHQFSMTPSTKLSSIFDLGPLMPKIYAPKFAHNRLSWLVWQIDRRCLGLRGGFRGWPI